MVKKIQEVGKMRRRRAPKVQVYFVHWFDQDHVEHCRSFFDLQEAAVFFAEMAKDLSDVPLIFERRVEMPFSYALPL